MNNIKVLIVSEYWQPKAMGGGEISAEQLAKALAKKGIKVHVLTSYFSGLKRFEKKEGVTIHRWLSTGKSPESLWSNLKRFFLFPRSVRIKLKQFLARQKFDAIHYLNTTSAFGKIKTEIPSILHVNSPVFFCPTGTLIGHDHPKDNILQCFLSSPTVGQMKNFFFIKYNPFAWLVLYLLYLRRLSLLKKFNHYAPNSLFMHEKLRSVGIPTKKITLVPNIIKLIKPIVRRPMRVPRILYIGAYTKAKGVFQLLQALKKVSVPYSCDFYGKGPLGKRIKKFVRKEKLGNKIVIHGHVLHNQVPKLLASHDIVVQPSLVAEAIPRTALEGLAAGKVVLASNIGGSKGIIKHNVSGLLFNPYNKAELPRTLKRVLESAKLRARLQKSARAAVTTHIEKNVVRQAEKIYRQLGIY